MQNSHVPAEIKSANNLAKLFHGLNTKDLAKAVLSASMPEQIIRSLPAQVLYMAIQGHGLESSQELIACATDEQYQVMLDFEFWNKDCFNEENFWHWLTIIEASTNLDALARFLNQFDRGLLASLICRYVSAEVNEEPTEPPTQINSYTPDRGYTWVTIHTGNEENDRQMGRVLAYIFDTDPDYFYRLIYMPQVGIPSDFEEEAFESAQVRLSNEGIPSKDTGAHYNIPLSVDEAKQRLTEHTANGFSHFQAEYPLPAETFRLEPLSSLVDQVIESSEENSIAIEQELTAITNASIVFYGTDFSNYDEVQNTIRKIRGSINIGLETAMQLKQLDLKSYFEILGLQGLYRLGITKLRELRSFAINQQKSIDESRIDQHVLVALHGAVEPFPAKAQFLDMQLEDAHAIPTTLKPIETLQEIKQVRSFLEEELVI